MYLVGWFAAGFILASIAMYIGRQWRRDRDPSSDPPSLLATALAAALLLYAARSSPNNTPSVAAPEMSSPFANNFAVFLRLFVLLVASLLLAWFAAASDRASLWDSVLWLRSPFLGARFEYLFWGAAFGLLAQLFRNQIAAISKQAFDATIGSKENTAWVLQGTLAILIIAAAMLAIKPDLLSYIRSLEYGGFKATFAEHASTARVANVSYKELLWGFTLDQYDDFDTYIGPDSDRTIFGNRLFRNKLSEEKKAVTGGLFTHYVRPVIKSLVCL